MIEAQYGEDIYLDCSEEYNKAELHKLFGDLYDKLDKAEQSGFKDPYVVFESTLDPYDPYPGPVEVRIMGHRQPNAQELAEQVQQKYLQDLADQMGVTYYEASVVDRLQKTGKVNLR
jgi:hypothetical protein